MDATDQTTTDWQKIQELNDIKESLKTLPWEQVQSSPDIIRQTILDDAEVDPAQMILMERTFYLSKLFSNYRVIPLQKATSVLAAFAQFDFRKDGNLLVQELNGVVPGLLFNQLTPEKVSELQQESKNLVNGLANLKKIAAMKVLEEVATELENAKKYSQPQLQALALELDKLASDMTGAVEKNQEPSKENLAASVQFLKKTGHLGLEMEDLARPDAAVELANRLQKTQEAFQIILKAYEENKTNLLSDKNTLLELAEKALSR